MSLDRLGPHADDTDTLVLRTATRADVPALVALNHAAYPDLVVEGVVFDTAQIEAHLGAFPEGQIVAEDASARDGRDTQGSRVVGAMATLVVPSRDALARHTWSGITADGTFATHDPRGDALYLADVYVDPCAWGRGVGARLYSGLWALCRALGLERVVAGGRLWGYSEVAATMTPRAYVDEVIRGARRDQVLTSQLRAGFVVEGILPGYLHDWRSGHYATLLTWQNPDVVREKASARESRESRETRSAPPPATLR